MKTELIKDIGFSKKNGAEHLNFHNEAKAFMISCGAQNINCTTELNDYELALTVLRENMSRQQASAITPQLESTDEERDNLILYLFSLLDAGEYSPKETIKEAYQALYPAMQPYRGIGNNANTQESADIQAMLTEISSPALLPHAQKLGMTNGMDMLQNKNQEYIDLDMQRVSEVPSKKETAELRNRIDNIYFNIVIRINSTLTLQTNPEAQTLAVNINNLIDRTNAAYKQRIAIKQANDKKKKKQEKENNSEK